MALGVLLVSLAPWRLIFLGRSLAAQYHSTSVWFIAARAAAKL